MRPSGISFSFPKLSQCRGYITHVLLTLLPLYSQKTSPRKDRSSSFRARLACLIHAASVHSEPGSNPSLLIVGRPKSTWVFLTFTRTQFICTTGSSLFSESNGQKPVHWPLALLHALLVVDPREWRPSILALNSLLSTPWGRNFGVCCELESIDAVPFRRLPRRAAGYSRGLEVPVNRS